ncbi:hypothetical protein C8J56DRAFT_1162775 [Mycena floridula]|nr:hypothetical protein C8J56DRAFT_1162775 [Mycena floridula]
MCPGPQIQCDARRGTQCPELSASSLEFGLPSCPRAFETEWNYSIGYHIVKPPHLTSNGPDVAKISEQLTPGIGFQQMHIKNSWRSLEPLTSTTQAIFGSLKEDPADNTEDKKELAHRKKLMQGIQMVLNFSQNAGDRPRRLEWMLEGLEDRWFARGIRAGCGFQLERDPEEAEKGRKDREC